VSTGNLIDQLQQARGSGLRPHEVIAREIAEAKTEFDAIVLLKSALPNVPLRIVREIAAHCGYGVGEGPNGSKIDELIEELFSSE
jgi:hypothetical protein